MSPEFTALSEQLREYHGDVKRRLDHVELAINGDPVDDNSPGLLRKVDSLIGFRERVRLGIGAAWALILTMLTIVWKGR